MHYVKVLIMEPDVVVRIFKSYRSAAEYSGFGTVQSMDRKDAVACIRNFVWARSKGLCEFCGRPITINFHMHEHVPRSQGGEISIFNSFALCADCHLNHPAAHGDRKTRFGE